VGARRSWAKNRRHDRDPDAAAGDLLAILDVGAYGYSMSSHLLNRPRPAEVMVDGGKVRVITPSETFDDLVSMQCVI